MADDYGEEWWIDARGDSASESDCQDDSKETTFADRFKKKKEINVTPFEKSISVIVDAEFDANGRFQSSDNYAMQWDARLTDQALAPFGEYKGPSALESNRTNTKLSEKVSLENQLEKPELDALEEPLQFRKLKKKKKKRKNKTQALAKCKNPLEPIKEFMDLINSKYTQMTIIERDLFDMAAISVIQEPLDTGKNVDLSSVLQTSLISCGSLLSKKANSGGRPFVLFITGSALRAMDLKRNFNKLCPECKVVKLFAKHLKIRDQVKIMSNASAQVAIGTPKRIYELIELDALRLSKSKYILIDWTWRDSKLRRMVEIREIKHDLMELLFKHLFTKAIKYNTQIVLL